MRYETIRSAFIAWAMLMNTAVVAVGLMNLADLTATANAFLLSVLALLNIPVGFYFRDRWTAGHRSGETPPTPGAP